MAQSDDENEERALLAEEEVDNRAPATTAAVATLAYSEITNPTTNPRICRPKTISCVGRTRLHPRPTGRV